MKHDNQYTKESNIFKLEPRLDKACTLDWISTLASECEDANITLCALHGWHRRGGMKNKWVITDPAPFIENQNRNKKKYGSNCKSGPKMY